MKTTYNYDPVAKRLVILVDGKIAGGFSGNIAEKEAIKHIGLGSDISFTIMKSSKSSMIRHLRALWITQGVDKYRDDILRTYGVESTADLNEQQLSELISRFTPNTRQQNDAPFEIRKHRSNVLTLLQKLAIYDNTGYWKRVNDYLMDKRIAGKLLYECSLEELKKLEHKLRSILDKKKHTFKIHLN